jgi:hypothetical protein
LLRDPTGKITLGGEGQAVGLRFVNFVW